jgi:hypothetical protein
VLLYWLRMYYRYSKQQVLLLLTQYSASNDAHADQAIKSFEPIHIHPDPHQYMYRIPLLTTTSTVQSASFCTHACHVPNLPIARSLDLLHIDALQHQCLAEQLTFLPPFAVHVPHHGIAQLKAFPVFAKRLEFTWFVEV